MSNTLWWPSLLVEVPVQNLFEGGTVPLAGTCHVNTTFLRLPPTQHLGTGFAPSIQKEMKTTSPAPSVFDDLGLKTVLHVPSLAKYPEKISLASDSNTYYYYFSQGFKESTERRGLGGVSKFSKRPGITKSSIKHPCVYL